MILPLGDSPNPRGGSWATRAFLLINIGVFALVSLPLSVTPVDSADPRLPAFVEAMSRALPDPATRRAYLAQLTAYDLFVFEHGFRPAAPSLWGLLVSMFLHANLLHLFGNMLFLWIYGDNVEHRLGIFTYTVAYLATGVAATLFHALFAMGSDLPLIGASGAISGVLGFYLVWFPRNRVRLLVFLFPILIQRIEVPARFVLWLYLIADNLIPFLMGIGSAAGGGVAHGAHIGGFVAGYALARLRR